MNIFPFVGNEKNLILWSVKKLISLLLFSVITLTGSAQIYIQGNTLLKRQPLKNVMIVVKKGDKIVTEFNTEGKNTFLIELDFGPIYKVYMYHPDCAIMYAQIKSDDVPLGKYEYRMKYEFDINFTAKSDTLKDTLAYRVPFHKIKFNGKSGLIDDANWNTAFNLALDKKGAIPEDEETLKLKSEFEAKLAASRAAKKEPVKAVVPATKILTGRIVVHGDKKLPVSNCALLLFDASGNNVQQGMTNRFGAFIFSGLKNNENYKIRMDAKESISELYTVLDDAGKEIARCENKTGQCEFAFDGANTVTYETTEFATTIGGKMVVTAGTEKILFADKKVFLTDSNNKLVSETRTNILGSFVFEGIKPGTIYLIGIDPGDLKSGQKLDILSKEDTYIASVDSLVNGRVCMKLNAGTGKEFANMSIDKDEIRMQLSATIYGNDIQHPISKLKILLLNENNAIIDSTITDETGHFTFKHLPYLKTFFISTDNNQKQLDNYSNLLLYSKGQNLIKMMPYERGKKFQYKMLDADIVPLKELALDDPWLDFLDPATNRKSNLTSKSITENILFESNSASISQQARVSLDKIILVLKSNTLLRIEIGAHTDSKGNEATNLKLSQQRAANVLNYIVSAGIDAKRVKATGYGETKLINNCKDDVNCSEIEHAMNRRIEFKIVGE